MDLSASGTGRPGHMRTHSKGQVPPHTQGLSLRVPPRQGRAHRWGPGPAVLPPSGGHAQAGSCSLGPSVGGRPPQTAACGEAARTDRSLWGGAGSGPAGPRGCGHCTGSPPTLLQVNQGPWWPPSPRPQHGPQGGTLKWAASTSQGTLEQAVLLGVLGKEGAKVSGQGGEVIGALVIPQGLGKGVEAGLAQRLLHGRHEQLGPTRVRASLWPLLPTHSRCPSGGTNPPRLQGQRAAVGGCWEDASLAWPSWGHQGQPGGAGREPPA